MDWPGNLQSWLAPLTVTRPVLLFLVRACGTVPWPVRSRTLPALLRLLARPSSTGQLALDVPLQILLCTFIFTHDDNYSSVYHHLLLLQQKEHQEENR